MIKRIAICLFLALVMIISAVPVYAADYQDIESVSVFRHLLETDDMLVVFHYDIHYDVLPTTPANKYYHFRLMDTDGITELAAATPYVYYHSGFDEGAGSFYFSAADAPTWEDPFVLIISGNPEYHAAPIPEVQYTLTTADYCQLLTSAENKILLGNYIISIAHSLETNWGVEMLNPDLGEILSATAESYFKGSIPNLQYMAPQIFAIQESQVPIPVALHPGTGQADLYRDRYDGTFVGDFLDDGLFGMAGNVVTGLGILGCCLVLFIISYRLFSTTIPALVGGYALILMGFLMGFMASAIFGICTLLAAIYIAYILFFRTSAG